MSSTKVSLLNFDSSGWAVGNTVWPHDRAAFAGAPIAASAGCFKV